MAIVTPTVTTHWPKFFGVRKTSLVQLYIIYSYDIDCQNSINDVTRFEKWFPDLVDVVGRIVGCILQMHIRNDRKTANISSLSLIPNVLGAPVEKSLKQLGLRVICQVVVLRSKIWAIIMTAWIIFTAIGTGINL